MKDFVLKHLERIDSNTVQKRRIFCLFHPDDKAEFEQISRSILKLTDCTVYYCESNISEENADRLSEALADMSCAVLIVSSKFLFSPCPERQIALPQLKASSLPILPILTENGLEESFNELVANIQCLCPLNETVTKPLFPILKSWKTACLRSWHRRLPPKN